MKGAVKRNTSPTAGRRVHNTPPGSQPRLRRAHLLIPAAASNSTLHHNCGRLQKPKSDMGISCRPQFYLSLEGYCFSRSCEGG